MYRSTLIPRCRRARAHQQQRQHRSGSCGPPRLSNAIPDGRHDCVQGPWRSPSLETLLPAQPRLTTPPGVVTAIWRALAACPGHGWRPCWSCGPDGTRGCRSRRLWSGLDRSRDAGSMEGQVEQPPFCGSTIVIGLQKINRWLFESPVIWPASHVDALATWLPSVLESASSADPVKVLRERVHMAPPSRADLLCREPSAKLSQPLDSARSSEGGLYGWLRR